MIHCLELVQIYAWEANALLRCCLDQKWDYKIQQQGLLCSAFGTLTPFLVGCTFVKGQYLACIWSTLKPPWWIQQRARGEQVVKRKVDG